MRLLTHRSIRAKLTGLMVLVSTLMLVILAGSIFAIEILAYRHALVDKIASLAEVVGENVHESMALNRKQQADEILRTLSREPNLRAAFLFRDEKPFARYLRLAGSEQQAIPYQPCPLLDRAVSCTQPDYYFSLNHLGYVLPIYVGKELKGQLYLQSGLDDLYARLLQLGAVVVFLLLLAVGLALLLSDRLQAVVTRPILDLAESMSRVTESSDFSIRLTTERRDETGDLIRGFNEMLSQLQLRDGQLEAHRLNLEEMVRERTEQLQQTNQELLNTVDQLDRARAAAEEANLAKSQFLANMSHEIRTPMIGVLGMTELLFGTGLNDKQQQLAQTVFKSGEALLEILNDLLDFSKIEAGKLELSQGDFDLRETIEEVVGLMTEKGRSKGLQLQIETDEQLPVLLRGDAGRLRQILLNLVGNAIKFTDRGEVTVRARLLSTSQRQALVELEVEDTGVGIPEIAQKTIFETFTQVDDSVTRRYGGTGLGLAIVRQLAGLMGGDVGVSSRMGEGSRFWVQLPFVIASGPALPGDTVDSALQGIPVLVLEENPAEADRLLIKLRAAGLDAQLATSGHQALTLLRGAVKREPFRVLLLDAEMPGLGGMKLVRYIAGESALDDLQIIMLADPDAEASLVRESDPRISRWLYRPILNAQLLEILDQLVAGSCDRVPAESTPPDSVPVLLVEDSETTCDYVRGVLATSPIHLQVVHDGRQALELLASQQFRLILMDCQMPVLDGFETTRTLRDQGNRVPIIALTARAFAEDARLCREAGMNDYLCKPFKRQDLLQMLAKWLPELQG